MARSTFPLPTLGPQLEALSAKLYGENGGRGFFVLRGLTPSRYSPHDNVVVYAGMASYVAQRRGRQDEKNNYLRNLSSAPVPVLRSG